MTLTSKRCVTADVATAVIYVAVTATALLWPRPAMAQLNITLDQQSESVAAGGDVFYSGGLANGQDIALFLDAVSFNFLGSTGVYFTGLPSAVDPFFDGSVPLSLVNRSDTYQGDIFGLIADVATPVGIYDGTATITSHYDGQSPFDTSQDFRVVVSPAPTPPVQVPEAGTALMILSGGLLFAPTWRRRAVTVLRAHARCARRLDRQ